MIQAGGFSISLDRREQGSDIDFISHAHSDHVSAAKRSKSVLSSAETLQLMKTAYDLEVSPHEGSAFELLDSGHMLGAKQLYVDDMGSGSSLIYTGDFQMEGAYTCNPIQTRHADIAVIDSTYPHPSVEFESHEEVRESIRAWIGSRLDRGIVLFTAFRMGKAQELISMLNGLGIAPVVSRNIHEINRVYAGNGIGLKYESAYSSEDIDRILERNFVGIADTGNLRGLAGKLARAHGKRVYTAVASGLVKEFRFHADGLFPFSSHADFRQTLSYIDRVRPERVIAYGSNREEMAANLRNEGIEAVPFGPDALGALQ